MEDYERYLLERIALLQREYEKNLEPLLRELGKVRALRPQPPLILTREQADRLRLPVKE